jgi:arylsulfatase A
MNSEIGSNARIFARLRILAMLLAIVLSATATSAAERPNIVMLLADDLGYKDLGCDGGPVKTPALDGLAASGVRFTDFYSGAPVCTPSRAVLLTGRQHARAGIYGVLVFDDSKMHLLEREVTLAEVLKSQGYATAHFGKWHLGIPNAQQRNKPSPAEHGFDYWFGTNSGVTPKDPTNFQRNGERVGKLEGYASHVVVDDAISWLDTKRDPDTPFFLNVWFHEPHVPVGAPDNLVSQYGALDDLGAVYSGCIDNMDRAIARLLDKLKEVDAPENTLIIYSSDNGSKRTDRVGNLRGIKSSSYDGGIRVPGIFSWPGTIAKSHVEGEPAGLVDVLPTVCGLLGIDTPRGVHIDGSNLAPLLLTKGGGTFNRHQPLFWLHPPATPTIAMRDGNYSILAHRDYGFPTDDEATAEVYRQVEEALKNSNYTHLIGTDLRWALWNTPFPDNPTLNRLKQKFMRLQMFQESWIPAIKSGTYKQFELYDLSKDPGQQNDLSAQLPEVTARLKKKMLEINASVMADAPDWD